MTFHRYAPKQRLAMLAYWPWVRPGVTPEFLAKKTKTSVRQLRRDLKNVPSVVCVSEWRRNHYFHQENSLTFTDLPSSPLAPVSVALVQAGLCYTVTDVATLQAVTALAPVAGWSVRETGQATVISTGGPVTFQIDKHKMLVYSDDPALLPEFAGVLRAAFSGHKAARLVAATLCHTDGSEQLVWDEWTTVVCGTGAAAVCDACLPFAGNDTNILIPPQKEQPGFFISGCDGRIWVTTKAHSPGEQQRAGNFHADLRVLLEDNPEGLCPFFGHRLLPDDGPGPCTDRITTLCDGLTPPEPDRKISTALDISLAAASAFLAGFTAWAGSGYRQTVSFGTVVEGLIAREIKAFTCADVEASLRELEQAGLCRREDEQTLRFTLDGIRLGRQACAQEKGE